MSTIELGELSTADPGQSGPEFNLRSVRLVALVAVLAGCLLGVTGSARPAPHDLRVLWSVPIADSDSTILGTDALYVANAAPGFTRVSAYDLRTGTQRWSVKLDGTLGYPQVDETDGLLLIPAESLVGHEGGVLTEYTPAMVTLDTRTGARLGTIPGDAMIVQDGTALMVDRHADNGGYARLRMIRLGDRSPIWSHDVTDVDGLTFALDGVKAVNAITIGADGQTEVLRMSDGVRTAGARIPWVRSAPEKGYYNDLAANKDHLMVNRNSQDHAKLSVYRLDTLAESWHTDGSGGYAFPCGRLICLNNQGGLAAYDADTGRIRWNRPGLGNGWSATTDRLVVGNIDDQGQAGEQYLVEADTGKRIGDSVTGETVWGNAPGETLIVLRATRTPPNKTSVTRWDTSTGRHLLLGALDQISVNRCQAGAHYLGCYQQNRYTVMAVGS